MAWVNGGQNFKSVTEKKESSYFYREPKIEGVIQKEKNQRITLIQDYDAK